MSVAIALSAAGCATVCWDEPAGAMPGGGPDYVALVAPAPPPLPLPPLVDVAGETIVPGRYFAELMCLNRWEHAGVWHNEDGRDGRYRGGLQFWPPTWWSLGGTGDPAAAPIQEQLDRAEDLADRSGWGQWPDASRRCDLR